MLLLDTALHHITQVLLYPLVAKLLGYRNSFRIGAALFTVGCVLMPLANHISGPIGNSQSDNSNSTSRLNNTTTWTSTAGNNMVTMAHSNDNHIKYLQQPFQSQNVINFDGGVLNYYGDISLDNNSTNSSCQSSRLGSTVGKNSIKRIPARVWLTVSWILTMCTIGRFV